MDASQINYTITHPSRNPGQTISTIDLMTRGSITAINLFLEDYKYEALFVITMLEGASVPIPSEVVLPLAGFLSQRGVMSLWPAFAVILLGNFVGIAIDYFIGYYIGKKFVYRHLGVLRLRKSDLAAFDGWFDEHGTFAVFVSRLLPVVRSVMSFSAGFAKMPRMKFFTVSMLGSAIWDGILLAFGYYLISAQSITTVSLAIAALALACYITYTKVKKILDKGAKKKKRNV